MKTDRSEAPLKLLGAIALAAVGLSSSAVAAPGTTINVNFGNDAGDAMNGKAFIEATYQQAPSYYSGTTWNDHIRESITDHPADPLEPGASFTQVNALDSDGNVTGIGYTTASTGTQYDLEGPVSWDEDHPNSTILNSGVKRHPRSGSGNQPYPSYDRLNLSGLDPAKVYNIYLASSQDPNAKCSWWVGTTGTQQFIENTTAVRISEIWKPGDNWTVLYDVAPDASGNIAVHGRGEANNDGDADLATISGLTLNGFQIVEATGWLNPDKAIYDFGDPANNLGTSSEISDHNTGNDITWNVLFSANLAVLSPTFTLADDATCSPVSGSTQDFTNPVDYTVTAEDGTTKVYHVTAVPAATASAIADMLTLEWGAYSAVFNGTNVALSVPPGTDITTIDPIITLYPGATVSPLSGSTQNFTTPVAYTVTAEDGVTTQVYTVSVFQAYEWVDAAGGTWSEAAGDNWDPVGVPASSFSTSLLFETDGTYTSTHDLGDAFQLSLLKFGGAAKVMLDGQSLLLGGAGPLVTQASTQDIVIVNAMDLGANTTVACDTNRKITLGGVISGANSLTKSGTGTGTMRIVGANTYSGGTTITSGRVDVDGPNIQWQTGFFGSNQAFGTGLVTISDATLGINRMTALANSFDLNNVVISSGNSFSSTVSGPITVSGVVTILDTTGTGNIGYTGDISGSGDLLHKGTRKGSPTFLSGTNTYTGSTTINGALKFAKRVSLPAANWTADKLIVSSGSAAMFSVGGAGEFTSADIGILAALGTATGGFADGSAIGLDTTSGNFTYAEVLGNPNGGANALSLYKLAGNTLTLTGDNTYSGQTFLENNGTLSVSSINSVATDPGLGTVHAASSSLGAPSTVDNGTIQIGGNSFSGGTIIYTGTGEITDRVLKMAGANNSTYRLDQSGSGLLKFTSDLMMGTDTRGPKIIDLRGSTTGTGEIGGAIFLGNADPGNETRLTKSGTGTWTLSGDNLYTGTTTVDAGELALVGGSQSSPITVKSGAFLGFTLGAPTTSTAAVTLEASAKVRISGTPAYPADYTLLTTTATITGTPELETPIPNYELVVEGGNTLKLDSIVLSVYETWAAGFTGLTDIDAGLDFESDGLVTGIEYVVGGDPTVDDYAAVAPTGTNDGSGLVFTYRRADVANDDPDATIAAEYSVDLDIWKTAVDGTDGVTIPPADEDFYGPGIDRVVVNLPSSLAVDGKLFARLTVAGLPMTLLSENFDSTTALPTGWTSNGPSNGTDWEVGIPSGVASGPTAANSAPNCAGTNIGGYYTENADVSLVSPAFAIPAGSGATLSFRQFIDTDIAGSPHDVGSVRILDADNSDTPIAGLEILDIEGDGLAGWTAETLDLPALDVGGKNIKVEFRFVSNAGAVPDLDVWGGFYVDDVEVTPN